MRLFKALMVLSLLVGCDDGSPSTEEPDVALRDLSDSTATPVDVSQLDMAQTDISQLDMAQLDMTQPDVGEPDIAQPDMSQIQPDVGEPDMAQPDMSQIQPDMAQPDMGPPPAPFEYLDPALWICRPDLDTDLCRADADAVLIDEDGTLTDDPHIPAVDPPFDCFYLYPTTSVDIGLNSDRNAGDEERFTTKNQVARYARVCRVFAPIYRQVTVGALLIQRGLSAEGLAVAYADVQEAFRTYLGEYSQGRPFLLIGHSQGATLLRWLIAEHIDQNPMLRDRLVGAHLLGAPIWTPIGEDVGGSFANVPLCRRADQVGCVVTYSTYDANDPPNNQAIFGRVRDPLMEVGCTNPAALMGGSALMSAFFPTQIPAALQLFLNTSGPWSDGRALPDSEYFGVPGLVEGTCVSRNGRNWLEIQVNAGQGPRTDTVGGTFWIGWGLHLADMNLALGDLVTLAAQQGDAWAALR